MIDLRELCARLLQHAVITRIAEHEEAWEWAQGVYEPPAGAFTPPPSSSPESLAAWERAKKRVRAYGPRIISTLVNAAVGDVNWGGESDKLDELLDLAGLERLARDLARDYYVSGVAAAYAYVSEGEERPTIGRLGGYIEPYVHPMDADRVTGLYQAKSYLSQDGRRWWVRVWDLEDNEVREWRELMDPTELGRPPDAVLSGLTPRFAFYDRLPDGLPTSPFYWAIPMMRDLMASELFLARIEEYAAYPLPVFGGQTEPQEIAPGLPVQGEFAWAQPGSLAELRAQREVKLERLRDGLALPGGFLGNDSPSGEALREANQRFFQQATATAKALSGLLTDLAADLARLAGFEPVPVVVLPNRDYIREQTMDAVMRLYQAGVIPLEVAAREIQPFFGTWSDEELNAWLEEQKRVVTPEAALRLLGGGA